MSKKTILNNVIDTRKEDNLGDKRPGFRVNDYFITFPEDEFVKEDDEGKLYIIVDIFKLEKDSLTAVKIQKEDITPEIEDIISKEINRLLLEGIDDMKKQEFTNE